MGISTLARLKSLGNHLDDAGIIAVMTVEGHLRIVPGGAEGLRP